MTPPKSPALLSVLWGLFILALVSAASAAEPQTLDVWPGKPPGDAGKPQEEQWQGKRVTHVSHPTLTVFRPEKEKDIGVAVIVCPGGGYAALMMDYEGEDVARWLNTVGVTGIVLKYRVPAPTGMPRWQPALQDGQRAVSLVRSKAKEWGIDPDRIGMLGFSAGGHLTAATSTNFDRRSYDPADDADRVSCRPDFQIVIYPGGLLEKREKKEGAPAEKVDDKPVEKPAAPPPESPTGGLSPEIRVDAKTPPAFIVQANDDRVNAENSVYLYLALKKAGVPAELHIYAAGGHGFGIRKSEKPCATWPERCAEWMKSRGILKTS